MQTYIQKLLKEFDNEPLLHFVDTNSKTDYIYILKSETRDFLEQALQEAIKMERGRVLGVIESKVINWKIGDPTMGRYPRGWNDALQDLKQNL